VWLCEILSSYIGTATSAEAPKAPSRDALYASKAGELNPQPTRRFGERRELPNGARCVGMLMLIAYSPNNVLLCHEIRKCLVP